MGLYNFIWIKHVVSDTNIFFDTCLREKKISKEGPAKKCFSQHEGTNIAVTSFILWITVTALPLLFTHTHQRSNVYTLGAPSTQVYYTYTLTSLTLIWLAHLSCWFTGFIGVLIIMISFLLTASSSTQWVPLQVIKEYSRKPFCVMSSCSVCISNKKNNYV